MDDQDRVGRRGAPLASGGGPAVAIDDVAHLLRRIRHGDQSALGELYDLTCDRLFGLASTWSSTTAEAEQLLGRTYLRLWRVAPARAVKSGEEMAWMTQLLAECRPATG